MQEWEYEIRCYYGKKAEFPLTIGNLAIHTRHLNKNSLERVIEASKARKDIGRIEIKKYKDSVWEEI